MDTVQESAATYLTGAFAPVAEEVTAVDLPVAGALPADLDGRYVRIGPNPRLSGDGAIDPDTYHWFLGEGMVHGVRLRDGRCEWYRNRYTALPEALFAPNTNVVGVGDRILALVEAGAQPVELSPDLDPVAVCDFDGTLTTSFTAHAKLDPATRIAHAITYAPGVDAVRYLAIGPDARICHDVEVPLADSPMVHDTAITESRVLVFDLPVVFDAARPGMPYSWRPDRSGRVGVLPLLGQADEIQWCEAPTSWVFHPLNAFDIEVGGTGRIVVDVARWPRAFAADDPHGPGRDRPVLARWTIDPAAGTVAEDVLDDRPQEFPRLPGSLTGRRHRYGYTVAGTLGEATAVLKHDLDLGRVAAWEPGRHWSLGEFSFVADRGAASPAEDDGWLMGYAHDLASDTSSFVVLTATDIAAGPIASVELPQRVPNGFHGNWIADRP